MLFHLAYISGVGSFLPTAIKTGARIFFGVRAGIRKNVSTTDCNVVFTAEELTTFRKSADVDELRKLHKAAAERGAANVGDEHCPRCGHAVTTLMFHCFNGQMILTNEQWDELDRTGDAVRYRKLVGIGRRDAAEWREFARKDTLFGFRTCPDCGASTSAKTQRKTG